MILALVDDLLFKSKISSAAKHLGVPIQFARTSNEVLDAARSARPSLVIIDLNSRSGDPLQTLASLKGDPTLAGIPTVGFVSHVQADLIARARSGGIDEVMARSAFVANLEGILSRDRSGTQ